MARLLRVVVVGVAHHVTQRGNARQVILCSDADRVSYLDLLGEYAQFYGPSLLGYGLMSKHVHLIAVPQAAEALSPCLNFPGFPQDENPTFELVDLQLRGRRGRRGGRGSGGRGSCL